MTEECSATPAAPPIASPELAGPATTNRPGEGCLVLAVGRIVASGAARLLWWWPGVVVTMAAYAAVALSLYDHSYPNLWGALAAAVVAVAWYASPMRRLEARRRQRLSSSSA
jgi:hypothetical protein